MSSRLLDGGRAAGPQQTSAAVQRAVYAVGDAGAVPVPARGSAVATYVLTEPRVQPGGNRHLANVQGRGFPGFRYRGTVYARGAVFNNRPMPDGTTLPLGQTYQEWDLTPAGAGGVATP